MLLVDNAAQPMQAAPVAALKGIAVSGNASKLHVIVTHFDQYRTVVERPDEPNRPLTWGYVGGQGRGRTADLTIFS